MMANLVCAIFLFFRALKKPLKSLATKDLNE